MKIVSHPGPTSTSWLVAVLGGLFTVANLGLAQSWTATSALGPQGTWKTVACSADGTKLVAAGYHWFDPGPWPIGISQRAW